MQTEIVNKIKKIRLEKGLSVQEMADKLNIDLSAYSRLESGNTFTWGKYLEDILISYEVSPESFFKGIMGKKSNHKNKNALTEENIFFEKIYFEYKEMVEKMEYLYGQRLKDKDEIIAYLKRMNKDCGD